MLRAGPTCVAPSTCSFCPFLEQTSSAVDDDSNSKADRYLTCSGTHLEHHFRKQWKSLTSKKRANPGVYFLRNIF